MRLKLQHCIREPISFLAPGIAPSQGKDLPLLLKQVIVLQKKCQIPHLPPLVCLEVVILTARSLLRASSHHQLSSWRTLRFLPTFLASDLHGRERYSLESPSKALTCPAVLCIIQLRQNLQNNLVVKRHSSPHRKLKAFASVLCFLHCSFFIRPQLFTASWMSV